MPPSKSLAARQRLTLAQLAAYDDILTDALVDHAYYWTTVPKNRSSYHPSRGIQEEEIGKIIQEEVVVNKNLEAGEKKLLATDGLKRFLNSLRTDKEKTDFIQHLRRYLRVYLPDCPWEVSSTNRYTIVTHEACVRARRYIKRNETVKYLCGIQINITPEEEKEITVRQKDFSIVVSSRKKCTSLFMGPARFANHDCRANAKLMTTGHSGIEIVATRPIDVGDEITVTYGDNYFGDDNCECLCQTCEDGLKNGWAPEDGAAIAKASVEEKTETYSLRRRRRDDSIGGSSRTPSVTPDMRPRIYKTKPKTKLSYGAQESAAPSPTPEESPRGRKRTVDAMATPPITPAKRLKHLLVPDSSVSLSQLAALSSRDSSTSTRSASASNGDAPGTDVTSPDKESPEPTLPTPLRNLTEAPSRSNREEICKQSITAAVEPVSPQSVDGHASPRAHKPGKLAAMSISSILNHPLPDEVKPRRNAPIASTIEVAEPIAPSIEVADAEPEAEPTIDGAPKKRKYQRRVFIKQSTPPARLRTAGDYLLTPLLLSEPDMAWIQCTNCSTYFVQQNAYFTKSACPRCERHSKLYGYAWPKTDKTGSSDKEERILDHRTIHRFLDPYDERKARGRKPLQGSRADAEEADQPEEPRRRRKSIRDSITVGGTEDEGANVRRSGRTRRRSSKLADW